MLPDGPRPYFSHLRPLTITSAAVKLHCSGATIFLTWELARLSRYVQILRYSGATRENGKKINYSTSCDPHHDMSGRIFGHMFSIF